MGSQSPFSGYTDLTVAFTQSTRLAVPSGITCFVSGSHIAICACSVMRQILHQPKHALPPLQHLKPNTAPKLIILTEHLSKGSSGSCYWCTKWNNSFTGYSLVSNSSLVLSFPHTNYLLGDQRSRSTFCCPCPIFPLGWVAKVQTHWNLSLDQGLTQHSFNFILASTGNSWGIEPMRWELDPPLNSISNFYL